MVTTAVERVETYDPTAWMELIDDFELREAFNELFVTPISEIEESDETLNMSGGEIITKLIEAVGEEFVLLPPQDIDGTCVYVVQQLGDRSLVVDDDIEITPDGDGVIVKSAGENRYVTATELRDVATADDLETVAIN